MDLLGRLKITKTSSPATDRELVRHYRKVTSNPLIAGYCNEALAQEALNEAFEKSMAPHKRDLKDRMKKVLADCPELPAWLKNNETLQEAAAIEMAEQAVSAIRKLEKSGLSQEQQRLRGHVSGEEVLLSLISAEGIRRSQAIIPVNKDNAILLKAFTKAGEIVQAGFVNDGEMNALKEIMKDILANHPVLPVWLKDNREALQATTVQMAAQAVSAVRKGGIAEQFSGDKFVFFVSTPLARTPQAIVDFNKSSALFSKALIKAAGLEQAEFVSPAAMAAACHLAVLRIKKNGKSGGISLEDMISAIPDAIRGYTKNIEFLCTRNEDPLRLLKNIKRAQRPPVKQSFFPFRRSDPPQDEMPGEKSEFRAVTIETCLQHIADLHLTGELASLYIERSTEKDRKTAESIMLQSWFSKELEKIIAGTPLLDKSLSNDSSGIHGVATGVAEASARHIQDLHVSQLDKPLGQIHSQPDPDRLILDIFEKLYQSYADLNDATRLFVELCTITSMNCAEYFGRDNFGSDKIRSFLKPGHDQHGWALLAVIKGMIKFDRTPTKLELPMLMSGCRATLWKHC